MSSELRLAMLVGLVISACRPDFGLPVSVVTEPRVLAIEASPPEARPGDRVHVVAFAAGPEGPLDARADYAFCTSPRPLVESNIVNSDCLGPQGAVSPVASSVESVDAVLPADGCLRFGPETPPQKPGEPPFRPRDPDVTGGYYQPLRVTLSGLEAVALVRIRCNLPGASAQRSVEYGMRYTDNTNPELSGLELLVDGQVTEALSLPGNTQVTLRASWPEGTAEPFVVHDRSTATLSETRESLRASWFTTAGIIPLVTSGAAADSGDLSAETTWTTPASGSGTLWAVLRDNRGGSTVRELSFSIR